MERVDLSNAKLDAAQLLGVRMVCSNLEKASLQNCNFEDPAGSVALMEGWLKHDEIMMRFVLRIIIRADLRGGAGGIWGFRRGQKEKWTVYVLLSAPPDLNS